MTIWIGVILGVVVCQRLIELVIARKNEAWMLRQGGIERGAEHYKWFIMVHVLFFISIFVECFSGNNPVESINYFLFSVFILTQLARIWCITSLGKFWNTKVIILPGATLRTTGPYNYIKHPNYVIVGIELFVIPLLVGAPITAIIFPLLHIFLLIRWRLPVEEKALADIRSMTKG
ncbi:isoprenylcysteine carboxyl methyltransferase family protein [Virgibacillus necropolis]|uniref:Isoprenylcysteine carboxyl methyltransferase n=1 Tax=Virgibacillus necropolis TaxID=163877 RepID=A0A221MCZ7_9BACI|nr:isoprenylcysteine carboxylmethyltransferase family protein [Virgibacillus necropolis]ASN05546.1 hypothetical protein CFK40_11260 [Virgibacillus necropolis]